LARLATGTVVCRKLASGHIRYAIKFRSNGERVYETLGTDADGWDDQRAQEALKDRLAEVRFGDLHAAPPRWRDAAEPGRADVPRVRQPVVRDG
jgi:hypothetical protein